MHIVALKAYAPLPGVNHPSALQYTLQNQLLDLMASYQP